MANNKQIVQLIQECQQNKRSAQKQLYLLYADDLMKVAFRYARDPDSAKDLVHDAFIKIFHNIHKYNPQKGAFKSWINRILINMALDQFRREKRAFFVPIDVLFEKSNREFSALDSLEAEDILKLLAQLPEGARVVFNLHAIEGYKHEEIGKMLGITTGASRSQLTRARQLLRKSLEKITAPNAAYSERRTG